MMIHGSLVIVGGGPVGLTLALFLARDGHTVTIIDVGSDKSNDGRVLALSCASQKILASLNGWSPEAVTAIKSVEISHCGLGVSRIEAKHLQLENLGYTVSYYGLCATLLGEVEKQPQINLLTAEVTKIHDGDNYVTIEYLRDGNIKIMTAEWLFLAEGGNLLSGINLRRNYNYQQKALVAHLTTPNSSTTVAYERFGAYGPLVLLPYANHYVVIWSLGTKLAENYQQLPDLFLTELNDKFGRQLGGCSLISSIYSFPLWLKQANQRVLRRTILLGNSAQLLHPVSAQGLNVGLRDVKILTKQFRNYHVGVDNSFIDDYHSLREKDVAKLINFTHLLATKMEPQSKFMQHLRGLGLIGLSSVPKLQNALARCLIYGF